MSLADNVDFVLNKADRASFVGPGVVAPELAQALIDIRTAVLARHWPTAEGFCATCHHEGHQGLGYQPVPYPCSEVRDLEIIWKGKL